MELEYYKKWIRVNYSILGDDAFYWSDRDIVGWYNAKLIDHKQLDELYKFNLYLYYCH